MAKNNFFQQNNRQKNKPPFQKAKDKKDKSYGNKAFKDFKNDNRTKTDSQKSHDSFFIKPSKKNSFPAKRNTQNTDFKESNLPKILNPDKNKSQNSKGDHLDETDKHPFDKKLYRLKKYSNKFKVQQWEDRQKKVALRNFKKTTKHGDSEKKFDVQKIYKEHEDDLKSDSEFDEPTEGTNTEPENILNQRSLADKFERQEQRKQNKSFKKAQSKFQDIKAQKEAQREDFLRKKQEKEEALKVYQKKKAEKYKKLSMKTKKGQPVMKGRMELLLEQIQNSINS